MEILTVEISLTILIVHLSMISMIMIGVFTDYLLFLFKLNGKSQ